MSNQLAHDRERFGRLLADLLADFAHLPPDVLTAALEGRADAVRRERDEQTRDERRKAARHV